MYIGPLGLLTSIIRTCTVNYYLGRQHIRIVAPVTLCEVVVNGVTDIAIITDFKRLPLITWDASCNFCPQIILIKFYDVVTTWTVHTIFKLCAKKMVGNREESAASGAVKQLLLLSADVVMCDTSSLL